MNKKDVLQISEICVSYNPKTKSIYKIVTSEEAYKYLLPIYENINYNESFYILCLKRANKIIGWHMVGKGGSFGCTVDVKIIAQIAILTHSCSVILAHNHPSGNTKPSDADISITRNIVDALKLFSIKTLDHIIVTENAYYSFADEGII